MTEVFGKEKLNQALQNEGKVLVMFYATWCPFSQRFLPIYVKSAQKSRCSCIRIAVDDLPDLCDKYGIEFYPTVILFESGIVAKRLDATPGAGLSESQLKKLLEAI